jgi:hypothetical protein
VLAEAVPSENSDSRIFTKDRLRDDASEPLDRARAGRVLPKRKVRASLVIIAGILRQNPPKVLFVEHDHMIGALASRRPDQAFNMTILPGRTEGSRSVPDAHRLDARLERSAERQAAPAANEARKRCRDSALVLLRRSMVSIGTKRAIAATHKSRSLPRPKQTYGARRCRAWYLVLGRAESDLDFACPNCRSLFLIIVEFQ